jgi:hemolysin activation/secretion protein
MTNGKGINASTGSSAAWRVALLAGLTASLIGGAVVRAGDGLPQMPEEPEMPGAPELPKAPAGSKAPAGEPKASAGSGPSAAPAMPGAPEALPGAAEPDASTAPVYFAVSRLLVTYASRDRALPPIEELVNLPVRLGKSETGFTAPTGGESDVTLSVVELNAQGATKLEWGAVQAVARAIVEAINQRGFSVLFVAPAADEIGQDRSDLRPGQSGELNLFVYTGRVEGVRTVSIDETGAQAVDRDRTLDNRVRNNSPLNTGDLARQEVLEEYLLRLNRHPGRRVSASFARADTASPNRVMLDYQIQELKPWTVYAQASNTGTESTSNWRQTFGVIHNQVSGNDDILAASYTTAGFSKYHNVQASYDTPIGPAAWDNRLRFKPYAGFNSYRASDVGALTQNFRGESWNVGGELTYNLAQWGPIFMDGMAGVRFQQERVNNELLGQTGKAWFVVPYAGLKFERATPAMSTYAIFSIEGNVASPNENDLIALGRSRPDRQFVITRVHLEQSMYLEPLLGAAIAPKTLAHEVSLSFRAQIADYRLPPSFQGIAGGFFSVRGYKESVAAGDSTFIGTAEYRFHIPRAFPVFDNETMGAEYEGGPRQQSLFGQPFRFQPDQDYGITDWDLIARAFLDVGRTVINKPLSFEKDQTLVGGGLGLEFQLQRNVIIRADWGVALEGLRDFLGNPIVRSGSSRLHFIATLSY